MNQGNEVLLTALFLGGALIGALVVWLFTRQKTGVAVSLARAEVQSEIARLQERLTVAERTLLGNAGLTATINQQNVELAKNHLELSASQQALAHAREKSAELERNLGDFEEKCEGLETELLQKTSRMATLEEQTKRLPSAEKSIADLQRQLSDVNQHLAATKESFGASQAQIQGLNRHLEDQAATVVTRNQEISSQQREIERTGLELRQLSNDLASKNAAVEGQSAYVRDLVATRAERDHEIAQLRETHSIEASRCAGLLEHVTQVDEVRDQLALATAEAASLRSEVSDLKAKAAGEVAERESVEKRILDHQVRMSQAESQRNENGQDIRAHLNEIARLTAELVGARAELLTERNQGSEKLALLEGAREQLSQQFKNLAQEILERNSVTFSAQNQTNLGQVLEPLKVQLAEFRRQVESVHVSEVKDRTALGEQINHLRNLNSQLSQDAQNLAQALKGEAKLQGDWGEMILDRVLELSGLRKGVAYDAQQTIIADDGTALRPDAIVHLPGGKDLIVDAKVSLKAYEQYVRLDDEVAREGAMKQHVESIRNHIKGLSSKRYQQSPDLRTVDFVVMFIPLEPAFLSAISYNQDLWEEAWKKDVLLVSPSTLLFVVRTVAHLWRQEDQQRNSQAIANQGTKLLDKFYGFVDELEKIGKHLGQAHESYDQAYKKLWSGRGSMISQAEKLRDLGLKPGKALPPRLRELARGEEPEDDGFEPLSELGLEIGVARPLAPILLPPDHNRTSLQEVTTMPEPSPEVGGSHG